MSRPPDPPAARLALLETECARLRSALARCAGSLARALAKPTPHAGKWHRVPHDTAGCEGCDHEEALTMANDLLAQEPV